MEPPRDLDSLCERLGYVPDWLAAAVWTALRDLQRPREIVVAFDFTPFDRRELEAWGGRTGGHLGFYKSRDGRGYGTTVLDQEDPVELIAFIADRLQDQVIWESDEAWAQPRPQCPGHVHPATPRVCDGEAVWVCPKTDEVIAQIGSFPMTRT